MLFENILKRKRQFPVSHIVSYPKSGNTWMRFLLGNYINTPNNEIDFSNIHKIIPDLHKNPRDLKKIKSRYKFAKSHKPLCLDYRNVIYLVRDVRDVSVSYYHFLIGKGGLKPDVTFNDYFKNHFVTNGGPYGTWSSHVNSWCFNERFHGKIIIVKYEDLHKNMDKEFFNVLNFCRVPFDEKRFQRAILNSSAKSMKKVESLSKHSSIVHQDVKIDSFKFVREAKVGDWRNYFDSELLDLTKHEFGKTMHKLGYNLHDNG